MKKSTSSPKVSRNFFVRLYPDCAEHMIAFDRIQKSSEYSCAWILHDRDFLEDGNPAKPHFHVFCFMDSDSGTTRSVDRFVSLFCEGLSEFNSDDVEIVSSRTGALRYLIHLDDPEKAQYSESVVSFSDFSAQDAFQSALKAKRDTEAEDIQQIISWIMLAEEGITFGQVTQFALDHGLWASYRRSFAVIREVLREHNYALAH